MPQTFTLNYVQVWVSLWNGFITIHVFSAASEYHETRVPIPSLFPTTLCHMRRHWLMSSVKASTKLYILHTWYYIHHCGGKKIPQIYYVDTNISRRNQFTSSSVCLMFFKAAIKFQWIALQKIANKFIYIQHSWISIGFPISNIWTQHAYIFAQ